MPSPTPCSASARSQVDHATIPTAVFSQPEVGTVGLTEAEARAQFSHVDIYKADFRPIKATMSGRDTRVLMKLVVDGTDATACSAATSSATPPPKSSRRSRIAVKMKATKADFDATIALHPTAAEELVTMRTPTARHVREGGGVGAVGWVQRSDTHQSRLATVGCLEERSDIRGCLHAYRLRSTRACWPAIAADYRWSPHSDNGAGKHSITELSMIESIGIIGAGTMGNGIAQVCAAAGLTVTMADISDAAVTRGLSRRRQPRAAGQEAEDDRRRSARPRWRGSRRPPTRQNSPPAIS